ncbi:MAG TPA: histidine kinase [Pricia sp.]|nr:histidine kinase [Pricia sp.]
MKLLNLSIQHRYSTVILHGIIWAVILALPYFVGNPENDSFPDGFDFIAGVIHLGFFYFNALFLYPKLMNRRRWWLYLISLFALIMLTFRLKFLILETGFPEVRYRDYMNAHLGFPLILFSVASIVYKVVLDRIDTDRKIKEREAQQLATELKFLRSQISPHFLFNVLNNMVSMARHKSDRLETSLIRLAGLMRYMLYGSDAKKVALATEIEYLESYIELQKIRFEEDVAITVDLDYDEGTATIEPMLLIPFVENAFKHGIAWVEKPFIHIGLKTKDNTLHFSVENKFSTEAGQSKDNDSGIGLTNIKARLKLLYRERYVLNVDENGGMFRIYLKLPLS